MNQKGVENLCFYSEATLFSHKTCVSSKWCNYSRSSPTSRFPNLLTAT